jgi:hypothetical protein
LLHVGEDGADVLLIEETAFADWFEIHLRVP